jgi:hypothetical protein
VGSRGLDSFDFFASMHQRESGGSFEVAIRDNYDFVDSSVVSAAAGWMLLQDGVWGWRVQTDVVMNEIIGDFNDDGVVDLADMDLLSEAANNNDAAEFDLDGDGLVDAADRDIFLGGNLITSGNKLNGDADFDGEVQFPDFVILAGNFGQSNKKWSEGDFDMSDEVQFPDFTILANNFGKSAVGNVVPEPATRLIALWAGLAALAFLPFARR